MNKCIVRRSSLLKSTSLGHFELTYLEDIGIIRVMHSLSKSNQVLLTVEPSVGCAVEWPLLCLTDTNNLSTLRKVILDASNGFPDIKELVSSGMRSLNYGKFRPRLWMHRPSLFVVFDPLDFKSIKYMYEIHHQCYSDVYLNMQALYFYARCRCITIDILPVIFNKLLESIVKRPMQRM